MERSESHRHELRRIARQAMLDRGLQPDFPPAATDEAEALAAAPPQPEAALRDLRDLPWCSIDNDDSQDLDQLSVARPAAGDRTTILVAIADVDALAGDGSAIDGHARANTTSVYTAAQIFPMLPERLSTDLTSLMEGRDRAAIVVEMEIASGGAVVASDVHRALVRNRAKLAYGSVAAWLDGRGPEPAPIAAVPGLAENIRIQERAAKAMDALRHRRGALSLETIQGRPVFDGEVLSDLRPDERNRAKEMIEDLMIAANVATATYLERKRFPSLRRVLRSPDRWERIVELASGLGEQLPPEPKAEALQKFLASRRQADPLRFPDLSLAVVKLLGKGEYVPEIPGERTDGHFGLAVRDYLHSTAPNRRFPDLITQRLLKAAIAGRPAPYRPDDLSWLASHCTEQEDNAGKVERQVGKSAAALLLQGRIGERFDAIVTGAASKGTWVRIFRPPVEGRVVRGAQGLDVGDRTRVQLVGADVEKGFIDFARVG